MALPNSSLRKSSPMEQHTKADKSNEPLANESSADDSSAEESTWVLSSTALESLPNEFELSRAQLSRARSSWSRARSIRAKPSRAKPGRAKPSRAPSSGPSLSGSSFNGSSYVPSSNESSSGESSNRTTDEDRFYHRARVVFYHFASFSVGFWASEAIIYVAEHCFGHRIDLDQWLVRLCLSLPAYFPAGYIVTRFDRLLGLPEIVLI